MRNRQHKWVCTNCGYSSSKKFDDDICPKCGLTFWKCDKCGFTLIDATPPDVCPECGEKGNFTNITCYIPDWNRPD